MQYRVLVVLGLIAAQAGYSAVASDAEDADAMGRGSAISMNANPSASPVFEMNGGTNTSVKPNGKTAAAHPTITGSSTPTVLAGSVYTFTPIVAGSAGEVLSFLIVNCPSWATFNSATGQLFGTPTVADIGTYSKISISASVGGAVESLPPFSIAVTDFASGSAALTWEAPVRKTDGTGVNDIVGFRIHYGMNPNSLVQSVDLVGASLDSYTVRNLLPGTWYFEVLAYSALNVEGMPSTIVSKKVL